MRPRITFANVVSVIALFVALGGTAIATHPGGQNTISTADLINGQVKTDDLGDGEVKVADIGQGAVATDEIANGQVNAADIADGQVTEADVGQGAVGSSEVKNDSIANADVAPNSLASGRILDGTLTGADVANNSLKGADIDEATLDVGDGARAYARVTPALCTAPPGTCTPTESKGISSITRPFASSYCVTAPGIDADVTPAAVTVDSTATGGAGDTTATTHLDCGAGSAGFGVLTWRQPIITVDKGGGTNNANAVGPAEQSGSVAFTIVIP